MSQWTKYNFHQDKRDLYAYDYRKSFGDNGKPEYWLDCEIEEEIDENFACKDTEYNGKIDVELVDIAHGRWDFEFEKNTHMWWEP